MKTKFLMAGMLLAGTIFTATAQTPTNYGTSSGTLGQGGAYFGNSAGSSVTSNSFYNTFIGAEAGKVNNSGRDNAFVGFQSGRLSTTGNLNTFVGSSSGWSNTTGGSNVFVGQSSGRNNTIGSSNTFLGQGSGSGNSTGNFNVYLGAGAAGGSAAVNNTHVGYRAGAGSTGSNNVFLGNLSGQSTTASNVLFIDNSNTTTPLIWGDFSADQLKLNGTVGIGSVPFFPTMAGGINVSTYRLFVSGGILTEEVRVSLQNTWADYVFAKDYNLKPLQEVEQFIAANGHLPNVPSAATVKADGIELGDMARIQQEKIEELTLYVIEQNKINEKQAQEISELKAMVKQLIDKK